jgi:hypothetical protein
MRTTTRPPTRLLLAGLLTLGLLAGTTACTGPAGAAGASGQSDTAGLGAQWGDCMRSAGFDIEDPSDDQVTSGTVTSPAGADQERFRGAANQCAQELGVHGADSAMQDKWTREYDQVASCVREAYPDFPEQDPGGITFDPDEYPRAAEPEFQERADECLHEYSPDTKTQAVG